MFVKVLLHPWSTWLMMAKRDRARAGSGGRSELNGKRIFIARGNPTPFTSSWSLSKTRGEDGRKLYVRKYDSSQDKDGCDTGTGGGG